MRAAGIRRYGGPDVLELLELPTPVPGPDQIRVRVHMATVNPTDVAMRAGGQEALQRNLPRPYIPGMELAGVVDGIGEGSDEPFAIGDRVAAIASPVIPTGGAHAEQVVVHALSAARIPDTMSFEAAATIPMNALTGRLALDLLALRPGDTLAVTGAAGAVGGYVVQLAVADGLRVIAVCRPDDAAGVLRRGAHGQIDRGPGWVDRLLEAVGQVAGLVDAAVLGGPVLPAVRDHGVVAAVRPFDGTPERGVVVHQVGVRAYLLRGDLIGDLVAAADDERLILPVTQVFPPDRLSVAHELVDRGGLRGRIVIDWS